MVAKPLTARPQFLGSSQLRDGGGGCEHMLGVAVSAAVCPELAWGGFLSGIPDAKELRVPTTR